MSHQVTLFAKNSEERRRSVKVGLVAGMPGAVIGGVAMRSVDGPWGFALGCAVGAMVSSAIGLVLRSRRGR
jgi:hypothetical protein